MTMEFSLEHLEKTISDYEESGESLQNVTIAIFDYFTRLKNNFKNRITRTDRLKRSELRVYKESNERKIKTFFKDKRYFDFGDIQVDMPSGFKSQYLKFINDNYKLMRAIDIDPLISTAVETIEKLKADGTSKDTKRMVEAFGRQYNKVKPNQMKKLETQHFSRRSADLTAKAKDVIGSFSNLEETYNSVLKFENDFKLAEKVHDRLGYMDKIMDGFLEELEKEKNIDKQFLRSLQSMLNVLAIQIDSYGMIIEYMLRVEHNFTLGFKRILKHAMV